MANNDDYLTVEEAKVDLRIDDDNGFSDADLERYRDRALGIVSGLTGKVIPNPTVDAADVDPGLKALCSAAMGMLWEGSQEISPSLYAMAAPTETFSRRRREFRGRCAPFLLFSYSVDIAFIV